MSADVMLREPPTRVREILPPTREKVSLERYLEIASEHELHVEYLDGEIIYMAAVAPNHSRIQHNFHGIFFLLLLPPQYTTHSSNLGVRPRRSARFLPDISVVRGLDRLAHDGNYLLNPVLVVEVLSPSTRRKDIDTKLPEYRDMPTMEHILIVEQDRPLVQHHSRVDGEWTQRECTAMDDIVNLDSLGASMSLAQIYRGVDFPQS